MKYSKYLFLGIICVAVACQSKPTTNPANASVTQPAANPNPVPLEQNPAMLAAQKLSLDTDLLAKKNFELFVLEEGKTQAQKILNPKEMPSEGIEYEYKIYKDATGKVRISVETPIYDGFVETTLYYDETGRTFAQSKQVNTLQFDTECKGAEKTQYVSVTEVKLYDAQGKELQTSLKMLNDKEQDITASNCGFNNPDGAYFANVSEFLKNAKIAQ